MIENQRKLRILQPDEPELSLGPLRQADIERPKNASIRVALQFFLNDADVIARHRLNLSTQDSPPDKNSGDLRVQEVARKRNKDKPNGCNSYTQVQPEKAFPEAIPFRPARTPSSPDN